MSSSERLDHERLEERIAAGERDYAIALLGDEAPDWRREREVDLDDAVFIAERYGDDLCWTPEREAK
jgi:hypothetical protein